MLNVSRMWYRPKLTGLAILLLPFSFIFAFIVAIRRYLYQVGIFKTISFAKPVIVVGNIAVGGTGKTPLVAQLVYFLQSHGYQPGIVSRGYGGVRGRAPCWVRADSNVLEVGDEALMLARSTGVPVVVAADRVAAVQMLLRDTACDIVLADDGLQHYRLGRQIEIAVVDGVRRFGNHQYLPSGPLREPRERLQLVDFVIVNGGDSSIEMSMRLEQGNAISMHDSLTVPLSEFSGVKVHAVAGIGHPERFFNTLRHAGIEVVAHAFADHHVFSASDFDFGDDCPILMTEKDAVKCMEFADARMWRVPVVAVLDEKIYQKLLLRLDSLEA